MSSLIEPGKRSTEPVADGSASSWTASEREWARKRLEKKNKLRGDVGAYVVINAVLIGIWALTGFGYFWPGWVLGIWGVLLLLDIWGLYFRRPITAEDIDRELQAQR